MVSLRWKVSSYDATDSLYAPNSTLKPELDKEVYQSYQVGA